MQDLQANHPTPEQAQAVQTQTYLVTGGAGFLGINLVRYLLARGHRVVSLDIAEFDYPERSAITEIRGDIRDRGVVDRAMAGVDVVVHTAAALPLYTPEEIYTTDIEGIRVVLQSALDHQVERVCMFPRPRSMAFPTTIRSMRMTSSTAWGRMARQR